MLTSPVTNLKSPISVFRDPCTLLFSFYHLSRAYGPFFFLFFETGSHLSHAYGPVLLFYFETGFHYVAQAFLEPETSCLYVPSARTLCTFLESVSLFPLILSSPTPTSFFRPSNQPIIPAKKLNSYPRLR
jgi:hypothetical protein